MVFNTYRALSKPIVFLFIPKTMLLAIAHNSFISAVLFGGFNFTGAKILFGVFFVLWTIVKFAFEQDQFFFKILFDNLKMKDNYFID